MFTRCAGVYDDLQRMCEYVDASAPWRLGTSPEVRDLGEKAGRGEYSALWVQEDGGDA